MMAEKWARVRAHRMLVSVLLEALVELVIEGDLQKPWY